MKVRAVQLGYYEHKRRRPGHQFVLSDPKHFSAKWMEKLEDEPAPAQAKPKGKAKSKVEAEEVVEEASSSGDVDVI